MGRDTLIRELRSKVEHFHLLIDFIDGEYSELTDGRKQRMFEALDTMKEIIADME